MDWTTALLVAGLAIMVEAIAGYPPSLFASIGHPVSWMGGFIGALERRFNDPSQPFDSRRLAGVLSLFVLLAVCGFIAGVVEVIVLALPFGAVILALLASSLLAARSLDQHVRAVADGLDHEGLEGGREAVAHIVGRNPSALDRHGVARAAIESLAENFSDGVVAPALWLALAGLPGAVLYKAVNTADSMIGHRSERYEAYGWAAARLDDLVNLPASRLSAVLIVCAASVLPGADAGGAWRAVTRDAKRHRSPNAGWPEAAMAGALGLSLAGPRVYGMVSVIDAYMGDGRAEAEAIDIRRALDLYRIACLIELALVVGLAGLILFGLR